MRLINNNQWSAWAPAATGACADDDERARADDDTGLTHLPRGKGSELLFVEKDGQVDVSGLDSPSDYERSEGPIL